MKFDSDFSGRIIQITEALDYGDAVSNQVIALDALFKRMGFASAIYSKWHHEKVAAYRRDIELLDAGENDVVILHFYGFSEYAVPAVLACYSTRILVYHNITPKEFFDPASPLYEFCHRGREQLAAIWSKFHFFWGDSAYNLDELKALGAAEERCDVVPIIVPSVPHGVEAGREGGSWMFVGRVAPNKGQRDIVELFSVLHGERPDVASRLYLVGGYAAGDPYFEQVRRRIFDLGLEDRVLLTGKVSDEERESYYRRCALFVSLSKHEGFGVPLVEASLRGLPVAALNTSAVGETLGFGGGLADDPAQLRDLAVRILLDDGFRGELVAEQQRNAQRFAPNTVEVRLREALRKVLPQRRQFRTVSVVICTYNRRAYLERALDYLRYQSCPQFEVVVVDGPSDDGTKALLAQHEGRIKIAHNPERNLSKSRNLGIELAAGDIVAFIDDDAIPFDDWIGTILAEYNKRPLTTAGLGGPVYYAGTLKYQVTDIGFNKFADAITDIESSRIGKDGWFRSLLGTNSTFTHASLIEADGFDEQYDYFLDESDLCWRLQTANGLLGYSGQVLLRHEFAESSNRKSKYGFNWYTICKNTAYFVAAYSGLQGKELRDYLDDRFTRERIHPFDEAVNTGELAPAERDRHVEAIWRGLEQGLTDACHFPRTRTLQPTPSAFLPYAATATRMRVGHDLKRLHVCIVSKEFPPFAARGGIGTLYYHLASELLLMGHEVTVIVPTDKSHVFEQGRFRVAFAAKRDAVLQSLDGGFANNMSWAVSALAALSELHSKHPVDVVDSALWDTEALAIALLPPNRRPPLVVRLVTPFPVAARINGWQVPESVASFFTAAERTLIEHADAVVPISESITETIESEYGLSRDARWRKVPCGVAYWPFFDVNQGYAAFQEFENIPAKALETEKLVVFIGRLEQRKGIDLVLQAANRFLAVDADVQLLIAGRDVEGWGVRAGSVVEPGLLNRIHFMGEVADSTRDKLLARAYCLLFPSRYESFGLVPLEAFVHGVPVVASRSGAIPEVIVDSDCGLLFEPDDAQSLAQAVIDLMSDSSLRNQLSAGARNRVKELSSRNMALQAVELYANLVCLDQEK